METTHHFTNRSEFNKFVEERLADNTYVSSTERRVFVRASARSAASAAFRPRYKFTVTVRSN